MHTYLAMFESICLPQLGHHRRDTNYLYLQVNFCATAEPTNQNTICQPKSLISLSFQDGPTIFHKGIFLKQTPYIKN